MGLGWARAISTSTRGDPGLSNPVCGIGLLCHQRNWHTVGTLFGEAVKDSNRREAISKVLGLTRLTTPEQREAGWQARRAGNKRAA